MSQNTSHTNPKQPATTKVPRQALAGPNRLHWLNKATKTVTTTGATMLPTLAPALKIPVAYARSRLGNHSATVLMQAGKFAASPRPSRNIASAKLATENAAPGSMAATLHRQMAIANALRVPSLSVSPPATSMAMP